MISDAVATVTFEIEAWLKLRDWLKLFKCRHHFLVDFFPTFWHFSDRFWLFLTCKYKKTQVVGLYNFYYTISLQFSKFLDLQLAFETETRPRLAKMGLETPSLMIIHICSLVLQQSYPVSNYFRKKNKNQFRIDRVESWTKL